MLKCLKKGTKTKALSLDKMLDSKKMILHLIQLKFLKKRGRKPKIQKTDEKEVKIPKKRGRKPMLSTAVTTNKNISENFITKDNVLHLKINSQEAENNIMLDSLYQYNPEINEPSPYDPVDNYAKTLENLESNLKSKYDDHNYSMDKKTQQLSVEDNNLQILETANILPDSKKQKLEDNTLKNENMQTPNNNITSANNIINYHEILENQDKSNEKEETAIPVSKTIKNTNHKRLIQLWFIITNIIRGRNGQKKFY